MAGTEIIPNAHLNIMALTVLGIFDRVLEAQEAFENLLNHGFSRAQVDLSLHRFTESGEPSRTTYLESDKEGYGLASFFGSLFGEDHEDSRTFSDVASRRSLITVHAESDEEARRAVTILDESGAIDVHEHAPRPGFGGAGEPLERIADDEGPETGFNEETEPRRNRSRVIHRPVEENLRLRTERFGQHPGSGQADTTGPTS